MKATLDIANKLRSLNLWASAENFTWAVKLKGLAFPFFCTLLRGDKTTVAWRFLMLEGWQTLHDFIRTRIDKNFGFYSTPMELPHYELVIPVEQEPRLFRHDPGFVPRDLTDAEDAIVAKVLWESYGVMIRLESDNQLPLKFSNDKAVFSRVETLTGSWEDAPLEVPPPRVHREEYSFPTKDIEKAKELSIERGESWEVDFRLMLHLMTKEERPRHAYVLGIIEENGEKPLLQDTKSVALDGTLAELWESVPVRFLEFVLSKGYIPEEVKVPSLRVFRVLRPLCETLPFKLSVHDEIPHLEKAFKF